MARACLRGAGVPGAHEVDLDLPSPFRPVLQELSARGEALRGVVHLWSLGVSLAEDAPPETLLALQRPGYGAALSLTQELSWMGLREAPRLFLVTRGAAPAGLEARDLALAQAPLLGLGSVIAHELPELKVALLDLDPGAPSGELEDLLAHLGAEDGEDQVALRPEGRRVARLVHAGPPGEGAARPRLVPASEQPFRLGTPHPGVLDDLALLAEGRRPPGPGEVEIEVEATGLNFRDVLQALGVIPDDLLAEASREVRLGGECAGRIAAVGEGVADLAVGQRVVGVALASFSSHVIAPAEMVLPLPEGLSATEAAAIPVVFLTAYYSLAHVARLAKGERVLLHAATGGVGLAALQWARHVGAEVYATAGSPEKRAFLQSLGVERVSDSRSTRFVDDVMRWTRGEGVDVVLNCLGGELLVKSLDLLRDHGRFVEIGVKDSFNNAPLGLRPFLRNLSLTLVNLRSFIIQRPDRGRALLLEVLERFREGVFRPLPVQAFPISRAADAFRFMAQARHIGKIVLTMQDPEARVRRPPALARPVDPAGPWVITGGLTGVGLATAGWLVDRGVRAVALLGRRAPSPEAAAQIEAWRAAGARIHVASVDVSDRPRLAGALDAIRAELGPIRGVVHSAVVLQDGVLVSQTWSQLEAVFAPKALGAWNLHVLTRGDPIEHFVLYSSAASVLGSPGQASYCAANALLDALAHHRQARGEPALTINWGPFSEIGLAAAQANRGERIAAQGMTSLTPEQAGACLWRLLGQQRTQVGVMSLDARRWRQSYPHAASAPLLSSLEQGQDNDGGAGAHPFRQRLRAASGREEIQALLIEHLTLLLAQVLRLDTSRVEPQTRMGSLGLDSLMAIELRNRLEASTGLTLSVTMMWNYPTVQLLSEHLLDKLGVPSEPPLAAEPPAPPAPSELERSLEALEGDELLDLFDDQLATLEKLI